MMMLQKYVREAVGWLGAFFSLMAFALNSLSMLSSQSVQYLALNILGSFLLIVYAVLKKAPASWVLNAIWLLITAAALLKLYQRI
ncbi:hypothetical protein SAMN05421823_11442 [Catalinimonas alkaloidigena]|uniref:CBU-0592-like domain-containing protein n=1 Tax=Catalinimonas alkaloidigena TaxID=1075417 RepID=A0A1G9TK18_9BACT|nr:hypothetical protein [Catalinimonas alkaloidigena]SDM48013.1 hypothetical protein SAMN05421823_11442 [Catalinimonas alkaloidigena]